MRRRPTSALLKLLPLLTAALLTHGSAAAAFRAAGAPGAQTSPLPPLNPNRAPTDAGGVRSLPLGTLVGVAGVVTTPPGAFRSSTEDEGFAIVDERHGAGVYVRTKLKTRLRVGSRVLVTGRLEESNGKLVIAPARARDVEARGFAPAPRPQRFSTREIGESTEGRLVRVAGRITKPVQDDAPYGFRFFVDDGTGEVQVFVSASTRIPTAGLRPGRRVAVTGFSGQYKDTYEVEPRFASDIRFHR